MYRSQIQDCKMNTIIVLLHKVQEEKSSSRFLLLCLRKGFIEEVVFDWRFLGGCLSDGKPGEGGYILGKGNCLYRNNSVTQACEGRASSANCKLYRMTGTGIMRRPVARS